MDKTERCDFCGALFNRYKRTIVNMVNDDNSCFTRSFIVCEECACGILEDLKKYKGDRFNLFGWKIKNPEKYKVPLSLSFFHFERPPQSWCYDWSDLPF